MYVGWNLKTCVALNNKESVVLPAGGFGKKLKLPRIGRIILLVLSPLALGFIALAAALFLSPKPLLINHGGASQAIYDNKGNLLRLSLSSDEKYRLWTPFAKISERLVQATLLYEDRHFYRHLGINPFSLLRAALRTYLLRGKRSGGSTISMQLARLRFAINSRSISGKLDQIFRALQLERHYTKKEILEAYLNLAPYGENIEGVGAASRVYFNKRPTNLTSLEAITLAVIPQNPTRRRPGPLSNLGEKDPLSKARERLFSLWIKEHPEDENLHRELSLPFRPFKRSELPFRSPHFVEQVLANYPDSAELEATLDPELQALAEQALMTFVASNGYQGISNASLLLVDWRTMAVRALVGSADYKNTSIQGQVDGTRAKRSPGSALKPFVYGLAIDEGLIHPKSILKDTPASFAAYDPENFDGEFVGPIDATQALIRSRNLPTVQLANKLSGDGFYGFLKRAKIKDLKDPNFYGLSLTLGGVEVSLQELVSLYASLVNAGELSPLVFLKSKVKGDRSVSSSLKLFSSEASFLVLDMLADNPRPGDANTEEAEGAFPVAWKTGTSFGFRDAWAVGVFGEYVLGVWVGNFDGKGNPLFVGRESAGKLFFDIVDAIHIQRGITRVGKNPGLLHLRKVKICPVSGELPGPFCKHLMETWFIPGKSPIRTCSVHREITIDDQTGLRACHGQAEQIHQAVFEFWPSDLLHLFRRAGIPRQVPPPYSPQCRGTESFGVRPEITSPQRGLTYQIRLSHLKDDPVVADGSAHQQLTTDEPIPFRAVTDADAKHIYWFVDERLVGKTVPSEPLFWKPSSGHFIIRAVDDQGRSDSRELVVEMVE